MMAKNSKQPNSIQTTVVEVKSKFDAEFRRFSVNKTQLSKCDDFYDILKTLHRLEDIPFTVCYTDPIHGDLLPINNDDNYAKALCSTKLPLRLLIQRKGECWGDFNGYGNPSVKRRNPIAKIISGEQKPRPRPNISISMPEDFRRVSAIIDVDVVPETHRRVKLMKNGTDKPLGFYIRDGTSVRVTNQGMEKVPGIFISRLVPGGLAESTGLLAVNDEVLEVNGIEVAGKTLDQVTDMMVANSANLIVTVKPVNQRWTLARSETGRHSQKSTGSLPSAASAESAQSDEIREVDDELNDDEDEVKDHLDESPVKSETSETDLKTNNSTPPQIENKGDKEDKDSAVVTL